MKGPGSSAAVLAVGAIAYAYVARGQGAVEVRGESCSQSAVEMVPKSDIAGCQGVGPVEMGSCCGDLLFTDSSIASTPLGCRVAFTTTPYCENPNLGCMGFVPTATHEMNFDIEVTFADKDETCCKKCKCYGDPLCEAFDKSSDELILCDGRNDDCQIVKPVCKQQFDFAGRRCDWLKDNPKYPDWLSNLESGSPCQPDFAKSGNPVINMYSADGFSVEATVGERGVIKETTLTIAGDGVYSLNSDVCFEFDPRDVGAAGAQAAWQKPNGVANVPAGWTVSTANDVEIRWSTRNEAAGVFVEIVCTKAVGASRTRIDVECITETQESRVDGEGYCFSGVLDRGETSGSNADRPGFHTKCLALSLSDLITTCRYATCQTCYQYTVESWQDHWCEDADLSKTSANDPAVDVDARVAKCKSDLKSGDEPAQSNTWIEYMCQANVPDGSGDPDGFVEECMEKVVQDGWEKWVLVYDPMPAYQPVVQDKCALSIDEYLSAGIPSEGSPSCLGGIMVESEQSPGDWVPEFYIPADLPPCAGADMIVNGAQRPGLFKYPIRLRNCGLAAECLVGDDGTDCRPISGFEADISFSGVRCTTGGGNCTVCVTSDETPDQVVCAGSPPKAVGLCESCCESNDFVPGEPNKECRELMIETPYCDPSSPSPLDNCNQIKTNDKGSSGGQGKLSLTFSIPEGGLNTKCCAECSIWGDPFGEDFNGVRTKLIECDSRADGCLSDETLCGNLLDHNGRTCVWHPDIKEAIKKKGDIGAFGSPCLPDWDFDGAAVVDFYTVEDFSVKFDLGERSVLDNMTLTTLNGKYVLEPRNCFENDIMAAWEVLEGVPIEDALDLTFIDSGDDGYGKTERVWTATDKETNIFVKAICIFANSVSKPATVGGYRLNLESLVDTDLQRPAASSGFCVEGDMESFGGSYTRNIIAEECEEENKDTHRICQNLWTGSCSVAQSVRLGIDKWCSIAFLPAGMTPAQCGTQIYKGFKGLTNGNDNKIGKRWMNLYCQAVANNDAGVEQECLDDADGRDYPAIVEKYGRGTIFDEKNENPFCADSVSLYKKKANADPCQQGVTVEYFNGASWVEVFFVPSNMLPCGGVLEIPATNAYFNLFINPWRVNQCPVTEEACPSKFNIQSSCLADFAWSMTYDFSVAGICDA